MAAPVIYDCVQFVVVRNGSLILRTAAGRQRPVGPGEIVLVAPRVSLAYEPEGSAAVTTILIDADYLIEHLFGQRLAMIPDRDAARDLAAKLYPEPMQVLPLGEQEVERLGPALDELVSRTEAGQDTARYVRTHMLLFTVLDAITPHVRQAPVDMPPLTPRQRAARVAAPRWRAFRPIRREAAAIATLLHGDIARRWRVAELAAHVCLSTGQSNRVFVAAFGVTPIVYLSILRVQEMARLIRETDLLITEITERVGWGRRSGYATDVFRRYRGVTPIDYRRHGPPSVSPDGPGVGVARAAANPLLRGP
ncbi:MAG: AraC family transcriptional regulator [Microbacterium sp.]